MIKMLLAVGAAFALIFGPKATWDRQLRSEQKKCHCVCGQVFAMRIDLPAPNPPGEVWHHSEWFGAHETICFTTPRADARDYLRALQADASDHYCVREGCGD